jgi:hypothetical protein
MQFLSILMQTKFHFFHTVTIPPQGRKRKATTESQQGSCTATIAEVKDADAPIALIERLYSHYPPHSTDDTLQHYCTRTWRWYQQQLWVDKTLEFNPEAIEIPQEVPLKPFPQNQPREYLEQPYVPGNRSMDLDDRIQMINEWASRHLIVAQTVYKQVLREQEPRYVVETNSNRQSFQIKPCYEYKSGTAIAEHYRINDLDDLMQIINQSFYSDFQWRTEWLAEYQILMPDVFQLDIKGDAYQYEEQQFEKAYKQFCSDCNRHFFNKQRQIRALKRRLAELTAPKVEPTAEDSSPSSDPSSPAVGGSDHG